MPKIASITMAGAAVVHPSRVILSAGNMLLHHGTTPPRAVDEGDEWTAAAVRRAAGARCRHASGEEQLVAEAATPAVSGAGRGVGDGRTTPARDLVADDERGKWLGIWRTMGEGVLIQREICKIAPKSTRQCKRTPASLAWLVKQSNSMPRGTNTATQRTR